MLDLELVQLSITTDIDHAFETFKHELDVFILGQLPSGYVYGDDIITVYTRKGSHAIGGALIKCLDIGTITISSCYQRRGLGMRVINHMHAINPFRCTFVESLLNQQLYRRLRWHGWKDVPNSQPPSVFRMTPLPIYSSYTSI